MTDLPATLSPFSCPPGSPLPLTPFTNAGSRWFDISNGAAIDWAWVATANETWISLSCTEGSVYKADPSTWETRVEISVPDWSVVPRGMHTVSVVINTTSADPSKISPHAPMSYTIPVFVNHLTVPDDFTGYVETDGGVSMEGAHAARNTSVGNTRWEVIPGYSPRTNNGDAVSMFPRLGANFSVGEGPKLEYDFYLFNNQSTGNVTVNLFLGPTLNYQKGRPLQYAVQLDSLAPQLVQPVINPRNPGSVDFASDPGGGDWHKAVSANVRISQTNHTLAAGTTRPGKHTVTIWGVEQGVVLEKIVVNTVVEAMVQKSYLGQPESLFVEGEKVAGR